MKTLILAALVMVFGAQIALADSGTECHQCHQSDSGVRVVRELR